MKFLCPRCHLPCGIFKGACPNCGLSLTLGGVLSYYWHEKAALQCPKCHWAVPLRATTCAHCGQSMTVGSAITATLEPPKRRWEQFKKHATPEWKRRVQTWYLIFSAALVWWLLAEVEYHHPGTWPKYAALSSVYLAVLGLLAVWLIPTAVFKAIRQRASRRAKLALFLNYLASMLVLQLLFAVWWKRALILAGVFGASWLGGLLLYRFFFPLAAEAEQMLVGTTHENEFDSRGPQGRNVRID